MRLRYLLIALLLFVAPQGTMAEVAVDTTIFATNTTGHSGSPQMVWVSDTDGFVFYLDAATNDGIVMASTTDGGASWSASRIVDSLNTTDNVTTAVWYDKWTRGDTGNLIHIASTDLNPDDTHYTQLNVSTGAISTTVVATTQGAACTAGTDCYTSITKAENGVLYISAAEGTDSWVVSCSATCTTGGNWSERTGAFGSTPDVGDDPNILVSIPGTNNVMLIYWDITASTIDMNIYSATSSAWWYTTPVSVISAAESNTTYEAQLMGMTVATSTGLIYLANIDDANDYTTADHDIDFWSYSTTTWAWTALTSPVTTASGGLTGAKVTLDTRNDDLYVIYGRRSTIGTNTTGSLYYRVSTDGGTTWSNESAALNDAADDINDISTGIMSNERIGVMWNYTTAPSADQLFYETVIDIGEDPGVLTDFASNVGATTARLNGTKTTGASATEHGFAYGTDPTLVSVISTTTIGAFSGNGAFSSSVSSLSANTAYFFRAYVTTGAGTVYGIIRSFTTGNTNVIRKMRLFEGQKIKILHGKIILYPR